jgi:hypothetical protein
MGIYYSADGSSFTSTLDVQPKSFFTKYINNDESDLNISYSDFMRVCDVLNVDKKDIIAAIIIQKWWRNIQTKKYKKYINASIIIQKWWRNNKNKLQNKTKIFSIWDFMWFNFL